MAYKHVIRAKTKNLMTDEMFTSAGFTKQPDGSWYVPNSTVLNNKVLWENTEGIAGPLIISLYGKSPQPNAAGIMQFLVTFTDGDIQYINGTGSSDVWEYSVPIIPNPTKTIAKIEWVNITGRPLYLRDVMFEWGSTPTPYTPYNYLQSNKRMIKVSDVCQLLGGSPYYGDNRNGIKIKNNGDGTFTVNGTATYDTWLHQPLFQFQTSNPGYHTYLLDIGQYSGNAKAHGVIYFYDDNVESSVSLIGTKDSSAVIHKINGPIAGRGTIIQARFAIVVLKGVTVTNWTIRPQLFDLTEMFGAGHEPATVAEFRQRFPNELYPYSPQCWLTSYKSAVICKTKNLFDYKTTSQDNPINWENIKLNLHEDYIELSGVQQTGKYIELGWNGFNIPFEVGKTYVLSSDTKIPGFSKMFMRAHYTDGQSPLTDWETVSWNLPQGTVHKRFTPTRPGYFDRLTFYNPVENHFSGDYIFRVQLEQGSTATSYVPYQHL